MNITKMTLNKKKIGLIACFLLLLYPIAGASSMNTERGNRQRQLVPAAPIDNKASEQSSFMVKRPLNSNYQVIPVIESSEKESVSIPIKISIKKKPSPPIGLIINTVSWGVSFTVWVASSAFFVAPGSFLNPNFAISWFILGTVNTWKVVRQGRELFGYLVEPQNTTLQN